VHKLAVHKQQISKGWIGMWIRNSKHASNPLHNTSHMHIAVRHPLLPGVHGRVTLHTSGRIDLACNLWQDGDQGALQIDSQSHLAMLLLEAVNTHVIGPIAEQGGVGNCVMSRDFHLDAHAFGENAVSRGMGPHLLHPTNISSAHMHMTVTLARGTSGHHFSD
jgi:hypothetical protein